MSSKKNNKEYVIIKKIFIHKRGKHQSFPFFSFQKFDKIFFFDYNKQCVYKILYNSYYEKSGRQSYR